MSKQLTKQTQAALSRLILATGNEFAEAVTPSPEYTAALELVQRLDVHLTLDTAHFYTTDWTLIRTLDEAVNAILAGEFVGTVPPATREQATEVCGRTWAYCRIDNNPYKRKRKRPSKEIV